MFPKDLQWVEFEDFSYCSQLQSIAVPSNVTYIGDHAFLGCSALKEIVLPEELQEVGSGAFERCSQLQSIVIPSSVKEIGKDAFHGCSALKELLLPKELQAGCCRSLLYAYRDSQTSKGLSSLAESVVRCHENISHVLLAADFFSTTAKNCRKKISLLKRNRNLLPSIHQIP